VVQPAKDAAPEYCVVRADFRNSGLKLEARLPTKVWNGKLAFLGGGGFDGVLAPPLQMLSNSIVADGYATLTTNGGHDADRSSLKYFDAAFALDPEMLADFTYRSEHRALAPGKQIIGEFYGRGPERSYYEGCSMGGHAALILAQRFPRDFDGIVARAPAGNILGLFVQFNRVANAVQAPGGSLSPGKRALLAKAVLDQCDALDNLRDGIIARPAQCSFRPETLRCPGGADDGDRCLSDQQIATIRTVTTPITAAGTAIDHPGYNFGGEDDPKGWGDYVWPSPALGEQTLQRLFSDGFIRSFVVRDPAYDTHRWNPEAWRGRLAELSALFQAFDPDLRPFARRGAKLILWNGTIDTSVSARDTARYYKAVVAKLGAPEVGRTVEYFEAPGVGHCGGGPGPSQVDLLQALDTWVHQGRPPSLQHLEYHSETTGGPARPLCAYPAYPRYDGSGDPKRATSFRCVAASTSNGEATGPPSAIPLRGSSLRLSWVSPVASAWPRETRLQISR
jgi:feruloyl esterase